MANVELMPGIKSISGKVGNMIFKTFKNGKVRAYPAEQRKRTKKLSAAETNARFTFGTIAAEVSRRMADGDKRPRKVIWADVKREMKGPKKCPK